MMLEVLVLCNFRYEVDPRIDNPDLYTVLVLCNFRYEVYSKITDREKHIINDAVIF